MSCRWLGEKSMERLSLWDVLGLLPFQAQSDSSVVRGGHGHWTEKETNLPRVYLSTDVSTSARAFNLGQGSGSDPGRVPSDIITVGANGG